MLYGLGTTSSWHASQCVAASSITASVKATSPSSPVTPSDPSLSVISFLVTVFRHCRHHTLRDSSSVIAPAVLCHFLRHHTHHTSPVTGIVNVSMTIPITVPVILSTVLVTVFVIASSTTSATSSRHHCSLSPASMFLIVYATSFIVFVTVYVTAVGIAPATSSVTARYSLRNVSLHL